MNERKTNMMVFKHNLYQKHPPMFQEINFRSKESNNDGIWLAKNIKSLFKLNQTNSRDYSKDEKLNFT